MTELLIPRMPCDISIPLDRCSTPPDREITHYVADLSDIFEKYDATGIDEQPWINFACSVARQFCTKPNLENRLGGHLNLALFYSSLNQLNRTVDCITCSHFSEAS